MMLLLTHPKSLNAPLQLKQSIHAAKVNINLNSDTLYHNHIIYKISFGLCIQFN